MGATTSDQLPIRDALTDAIRYWEWRRIPYNLVLALVVVGSVALTWPRSSPFVSLPGLLFFFVLAVIANVCYATAYVVDIPLQLSGLRPVWQRRRWALWARTLFAAALAFYWMADEVISS